MERSSRASGVVVVFVALALLAGCAGATQAAIDVDGREISRGDLNGFLDVLAANETALGLRMAGPHPGLVGDLTNPSEGAVQAILLMVQSLIAESILDDRGETVTDADRAAQEEVWADLPTDVRAAIVAQTAPLAALDRVTIADGTTVDVLLFSTDPAITLDPRYGSWNDGRYTPPGG